MHYNLVKASNRRYLEELKNRGHEMKPVYDAVNIMQDTEWVINKPIYEVILKLIDTDSSLGKLPTNPQEIPLPVKPVDVENNDEQSETYKENLIKWKVVQGGMIPKIENCVDAVQNGVRGVVILDGRKPHSVLHEIFSDKGSGTLIRE